MKPITRYQSDDGKVFSTAQTAGEHEALLKAVAVALSPLGKRRDDIDKGWVQHSAMAFKRAKLNVLTLALPAFKGFPLIVDAIHNDPDSIHMAGIVGRILSDNDGPLSDGWWRLSTVDSQYREHNQPFFGAYNNPPSKHHVMLEDRA